VSAAASLSSQDIVSLQSFIVGVNHPFIAPPSTCKAYPIAILLHDHCAIYALPPTPLSYAIHHTILGMAISCKGQGAPWPLHDIAITNVVWCMACTRRVGWGGSYIAQQSCNNSAIVWAMRVGGGMKSGMIRSHKPRSTTISCTR